MSQAELARRINFSRGYLCNVEKGTKPLTLAMARACDKVLGGSLVALVGNGPDRRAARGGLPPATAKFTGRARELERVVQALSVRPDDGIGTVVACSITGLGGVGKTALALRAAHLLRDGFPGGCLFIDLHGYDGEAAVDPADALYRLLVRLGVTVEEIPPHLEDRSALFRDRLADRRLLLVLDNARDAEQVAPLLPSTPGCPTLITSRDALTALDDVERVPLGALPADDAVTLLRSLFRGALSDAELRRVAAWAGYLPLALRIAPASFADCTPEELAERLGDTGNRLGDFDHGGRSLTEVFAHSLERLAPDLERTLLLLGLHPGAEFDLRAAAALTGTDVARARRHLRSLRDLSLLTPQGGDRYRIHDLLRLYTADAAADRLPAAQRRAAIVRGVDHYLRSAAAADQVLTPDRFVLDPPQGEPVVTRTFHDYDRALIWAVTEQGNLVAACRTAFAHGLDEHCWVLAHILRGFFFLTKTWTSWRETHELALDAARRAGNRHAEAVVLSNLGLAHLEQGDHETAGALYRAAHRLFTELDDPHGVHTSLAHHAWVHFHRGDLNEALRESLAALEFMNKEGSARKRAILLRDIASIEIALGRHDDAVARLEEAWPIFLSVGSRIDQAMARNCLGEAYLGLARLEDAERELLTAERVSRDSGSPYEHARALENLGRVEQARDSPERARTWWAEALEVYRKLRAERAVRRVSRLLRSDDPAVATDPASR